MLDLTALTHDDIVIVTEDLINPGPDRRTKGNWTLATTIPKGTKLRVRTKTLDYYGIDGDTFDRMRAKDPTLTKDSIWRYQLVPLGGGDGLTYCHDGTVRGIGTNLESKTDKLADALLKVLEPLGDKMALGDLLRQKEMVGRHMSNQCDRLLAVLLDSGKLDLADVRMAISVYDGIDYDNGDWEKFSTKHAL